MSRGGPPGKCGFGGWENVDLAAGKTEDEAGSGPPCRERASASSPRADSGVPERNYSRAGTISVCVKPSIIIQR